MTVVLALVPPARPSVLRAAPLRLAVFDCSVLSTDVIAATSRLPLHSAFVEAMLEGSLRGFITRTVWAEVPRVLEDRWRETKGRVQPGSGAADLVAYLRSAAAYRGHRPVAGHARVRAAGR